MPRFLLASLVAAITVALPTASLASADPVPVVVATSDHRASTDVTLQARPCSGGQNMGKPNGGGFSAQDFEAPMDAYDTIGGADFTLTAKCELGSIYVDGVEGYNPPNAVHWAISTSTEGRQPFPDKLVRYCSGTVRLSGLGVDLDFDVPRRCVLSAGVHYWLTIQAQLGSGPDQWFWRTTSKRVAAKDVWKNPGDAFDTGCVDWGTIGHCLGAEFDSSDYRFSLRQYGT